MSTKTIAERTWTVDLPDRYRFNARAALDHIEGNRRPHFTTTGELLNLRRFGDNHRRFIQWWCTDDQCQRGDHRLYELRH